MKKLLTIPLIAAMLVLLNGCQEAADLQKDATESFDNLKNEVIETKENVENTVNSVKETADNVKETAGNVSNAVSGLNDAVNGASGDSENE